MEQERESAGDMFVQKIDKTFNEDWKASATWLIIYYVLLL